MAGSEIGSSCLSRASSARRRRREFVVPSLSRLFLEAASLACRAGLACGVANFALIPNCISIVVRSACLLRVALVNSKDIHRK